MAIELVTSSRARRHCTARSCPVSTRPRACTLPGHQDHADRYSRWTFGGCALIRWRRSGVQRNTCAASSHKPLAQASARTTPRTAPKASERGLRSRTARTLPVQMGPAATSRNSPDFAALRCRPHHGVARTAGKGVLERRQIRERSDHPVFGDGVRIALEHQALRLGPRLVAAELSPGDEELLLGREPVADRLRMLAQRLLERGERDARAGEIADRFAKDQAPVVMDGRLDVEALELVHHALAALAEGLEIRRGPPVVQPPGGVELRPLIVETMADLVADHDADGAIVDGVGSLEIEGRRLEDARRKDDLVEQRVVVRIGGGRSHAPAPSIRGLPDGRAEVVDDELPTLQHVLPDWRITADAHPRIVLPLVRISDLRVEGGELLQRPPFRLRPHPAQAPDDVLHRRELVAP